MPRKPRIELAGYHHIINRGVNRSVVFVDDNDYEMFLKIVCKACRVYGVVLHDYCLMSNHFHLLAETARENLSSFMKQINANYAIYANKKQKRSGHFWQGRYYSRYINSENYYYTLIRYIEQNPVEAGIVSKVEDYPYTLGSVIANGLAPVSCALKSKLLQELSYENIQDIIGVKLNKRELETLKEIKELKIIEKGKKHKIAFSKTLDEHFKDADSIIDRNKAMVKAVDDSKNGSGVENLLKLRYIFLKREYKCQESHE